MNLGIFRKFFNESGIIAGKFKGDKNPGEKFYQRFSKVLLVLVILVHHGAAKLPALKVFVASKFENLLHRTNSFNIKNV